MKKISFLYSILTLFIPAFAIGQTSVSGIKLTEESVLHVAGGESVIFDSNVNSVGNNNEKSAFKLSTKFGSDVEVPGQLLQVLGGARLVYDRYMGEDIGDANLFGWDIKSQLGLNRKGKASLFANLATLRTPSLTQDQATIISDSKRYRQNFYTGTLSTELKPGGGALRFTFGSGIQVAKYDKPSPSEQPIPGFNKLNVNGLAFLKFFPRTAATLSARYDIHNFEDGDEFDAKPWQVLGGMVGQLTERLSLLIDLGFAALNINTLSPENEFSSFVGRLEGTYKLSDSNGFKLGVAQSFDPTQYFGYLFNRKLYFEYSKEVISNLFFDASASYDIQQFGINKQDTASSERKDNYIVSGVKLGYMMLEWLSLSTGLDLAIRTSDKKQKIGNEELEFGYNKYQFFVAANVMY